MGNRTFLFRVRFLAGAFLLIAGLAGPSARADLVQTQKQDLVNLPTKAMTSVSFDKFDPGKGTLDSVTVELSNLSMSSEIHATYGGRGTTTVTDSVTGHVTLEVPSSMLEAGASGTISPTFALNFSRTMAGPADNFDVFKTLALTSPASGLTLTFSGAQAQGFVGSGAFSLLFSADTSGVLENTNGAGSRYTQTSVTGTPQVIYHYSVKIVPEPASLWLLALGSLALPALAMARRRAARA